MSQQASANLKDSGGGGAKNLAGSEGGVDQSAMRGSAERVDEVVLSESTGTVGLIFIEQKDGIVVLMCVSFCSIILSHCYPVSLPFPLPLSSS
jgi:hypothetical protein